MKEKIKTFIKRIKVKDFFTQLLAILFILFVVFSYFKTDNLINEQQVKGENYECTIDLYLDEARIKANNNQKALSILKENCLWLLEAKIEDYDGDNQNEIAMVTSGAGCGSCHGNILYIIKDDRVIFQKEAEDIGIQPAKDLPGFTIKHPIRKDNEPLCCPSEGIVEFYKTKGIGETNESFNKVREIVEPY